ncbi:hypothetical protein M3Y97_01099000 [Aphelenchoides bicaudatus]|nr:hypothetical protein M3Y97_01099000 [Aphelenchoides bicaudatus]
MNLKFALVVLLIFGVVSIEARFGFRGSSRARSGGHSSGGGHSYGGHSYGAGYNSPGNYGGYKPSGGYNSPGNYGGYKPSGGFNEPQYVPPPQPKAPKTGSGLGSIGTHVGAAAAGAVVGGMLSRPNNVHHHHYGPIAGNTITTTVRPPTTVTEVTSTATQMAAKKDDFLEFLRQNGEEIVTVPALTTSIPTKVDPKIAEKAREDRYRASKAKLLELIQDIKWAQKDPEHVAKVNVLKKEVNDYEKEKKMY